MSSLFIVLDNFFHFFYTFFMGIKEKNLFIERLGNLKPNERLFRINAGMGWIAAKKDTIIKRNKDGGTTVLLKNARPFHGAPEGWLDLCGWTEIIITPDMVGKNVAVFTFEEGKTGKQRIVKESAQDKFKNLIIRMGGIFRELRD